MKNAVMPLEDYDASCDNIREKLGTEDLIKSGELPEKIDEVYEAGQKAEYDNFWDAFQDYGNRRYYYSAFASIDGASYGWNDVTFKPKYDIILGSGTYDNTSMLEYSPITNIKKSLEDCGVTMDFSKATWLNAPFRGAKTTHLPPIDVSSCTDIKMAFYNMPNLKALEIHNLRADCVFDRAIAYCYALEELRITGTIGNNGIDVQYSPLTKESLLNIIDCLKDFGETVVEHRGVNVSMPYILTTNTLVEGAKYYLTYEGDDFEPYTAEATAGQVTVMTSGISALGLQFEMPSQTSGDIPLVWVYQDGGNLMYDAYFTKSNAKITLSKAPTETRSITFGTSNLAKLTDAEKAVATQKGWTLL